MLGMTVSGYPLTADELAQRELRAKMANAQAMRDHAQLKHFTVADMIAKLSTMPQDMPMVVSGVEGDDCGCCESQVTSEASNIVVTQGNYYKGTTRCFGQYVEVRYGSP